jgi:hypothetical protein
MNTTENKNPKVGQTITIGGILCRIVKISHLGVLDCVEVNGNRAFLRGPGFIIPNSRVRSLSF